MEKVTVGIEETLFIPEKQLDHEWIDLILEAKKLGITLEEIRSFLLLQK